MPKVINASSTIFTSPMMSAVRQTFTTLQTSIVNTRLAEVVDIIRERKPFVGATGGDADEQLVRIDHSSEGVETATTALIMQEHQSLEIARAHGHTHKQTRSSHTDAVTQSYFDKPEYARDWRVSQTQT
jgi:hypothetical protein